MSATLSHPPGKFIDGQLPPNVRLGGNTLLKGEQAFTRFHSQLGTALTIGDHCTMDGVQFALHEDARITIGDYCYFPNCLLMCEMEIGFGNYFLLGWKNAISHRVFSSFTPPERIADPLWVLPFRSGKPPP